MSTDSGDEAMTAQRLLREGAEQMGAKLARRHAQDLTAALAAHRGRLPDADMALLRGYLQIIAAQLCATLGPKSGHALLVALADHVKEHYRGH